MKMDKDDIRAAVAANVINEAQAASLMALAASRHGVRENMDGLDEPFELFRGFNEIFIVVGLGVLFAGWMGVTGISAIFQEKPIAHFAVYGVITMAVAFWLSRYFTLKRRMVAPSIALVMMFAIGALQVVTNLSGLWNVTSANSFALIAAGTTLALVFHYSVFRVPFTMLPIALGVFASVGAFFVLGGAEVPDLDAFFRLSADGPFALITIALGLLGVAVALRFDMSDPHRVTRRSSSGFWLHVIAAPAIVNTVALTLLEFGTLSAQLLLLAFLTCLAIFAIAIDRRSFLVAGVGYVVAVAVILLKGQAAMAILLLGLGLVFLGAKWEVLRAAIMDTLPNFAGKNKLPPWGLTETNND